ncbi:MptD family putative ECF transporter S component [Clostridium sp. MB40-C1]|uniref:MptD family putative ECF transporter S component n=1 Tax=Clostridium sp. MB40-C1 TaxID=3070996 RepID=UPI0027DFB302|nr:MptD family putative ECF transporter S component [Clostridium sp. MB40-C1]WMJ81566.1 MptD family putative ECF transporter S component [Clostridium sp. MB40-C1]
MENPNKLVGKDLINVGIYTAMYIAVFFVFGLLTALPVVYPFLMFLLPFICGVPMMLYYTKINKFGMLTITGIINGIFFFLIGYTWIAIAFWTVFGFLADLVLKAGGYKNFKFSLLSYSVYCLGEMGCHGPLFLAGQSYWDNIRNSMGTQYADTLMKMTPQWLFYAGFVILFVGGICGALLGHKMLKKHFKRAGIA